VIDLTKTEDLIPSPCPTDEERGLDALVFYIGTQHRPGLGVEVHRALFENPRLGRLVVEDARRLLDGIEKKVAEAEAAARNKSTNHKKGN
jgi:hypothetical protein